MSKTSSAPIKLTLFHATWCGHCTQFMPEWNKMKDTKKAAKIIKFDEYESKQINSLPQKERTINGGGIEGFPTLKVEVKGNEYEYNGPRTSTNIYQFVADKLKEIKENKSTQTGGCGCGGSGQDGQDGGCGCGGRDSLNGGSCGCGSTKQYGGSCGTQDGGCGCPDRGHLAQCPLSRTCKYTQLPSMVGSSLDQLIALSRNI